MQNIPQMKLAYIYQFKKFSVDVKYAILQDLSKKLQNAPSF